MFSALRPGATLYILDKTESPVVKIAYVENVTAPHPLYKTYNPAVSFGTNMQMAVDVTVKLGNEKKEFVGLPSNESLQRNGDYVVSETREAMIQEIDAMLQSSKSVIESVDSHKKIIAACEDILKDLNPVYAKEQERDTAIDSLKEEVNSMKSILARLETALIKTSNENNQEL